jgi:hypothetical protein
MSQENYAGTAPISMPAGGAITRNALVVLNASGQVVVTSAITDRAFGVALQAAASGEMVPVLVGSGCIVTLVANAAITAGAELMPAASGAGNVATAAGATALSCGQAITAAAALGDLIQAVLRPTLRSPVNT